MDKGTVNIYADRNSLVQLALNKEFSDGKHLQQVVKSARIVLLMQQEELDKLYEDLESDIRKFCDAYDISKPSAEFVDIFRNPRLCYEKDPFALWFINTNEDNINKFKNYFGVWMVNTILVKDDSFKLDYPSDEFVSGDIINGESENGYQNYIDASPVPLPPMNSILINDRWFLDSTNKNNIQRNIRNGLKNFQLLLEALLPNSELKIPFHVTVYCQHPDLSTDVTERLVRECITQITSTKSYEIKIEFIFSKAEHKRILYTNYFSFKADRGFNAFKPQQTNMLWGENDFTIKGYLDNPIQMIEYKNARKRIKRIYEEGCNIVQNPSWEIGVYAITDSDNFFHNRLFPDLCN